MGWSWLATTKVQVVPEVLQASSVEQKNSVLCNHVYDVIANQFSTQPLCRSQGKVEFKLKQHDRALKEVTKLKNSAKQALRRAAREGQRDPATVQTLVANFLSHVRTCSRLKPTSWLLFVGFNVMKRKPLVKSATIISGIMLLDSQSISVIIPTFTASSAQSYFSDVYKSSAHQFEIPSCMPIPHSHIGMTMESISQEELAKAIRQSGHLLLPLHLIASPTSSWRSVHLSSVKHSQRCCKEWSLTLEENWSFLQNRTGQISCTLSYTCPRKVLERCRKVYGILSRV